MHLATHICQEQLDLLEFRNKHVCQRLQQSHLRTYLSALPVFDARQGLSFFRHAVSKLLA